MNQTVCATGHAQAAPETWELLLKNEWVRVFINEEMVRIFIKTDPENEVMMLLKAPVPKDMGSWVDGLKYRRVSDKEAKFCFGKLCPTPALVVRFSDSDQKLQVIWLP